MITRNSFHPLHYWATALDTFQKSQGIISPASHLYFDIGIELFGMNLLVAAHRAFNYAESIDPDLFPAFGNALYIETKLCNWTRYHDGLTKITKIVVSQLYGRKDDFSSVLFVEPHMSLAYPFQPKLKLLIAQDRSLTEKNHALKKLANSKINVNPLDGTRKRGTRIRVGYISADFRAKATSYLVRDMFRYHDREKYEIFVFATTSEEKEKGTMFISESWRTTIQKSVEHFVDLSQVREKSGMSDQSALAECFNIVKEKDLDILVDMDGWSNQGIRLEGLLSLRPAKIQISMLVYVGTTGAPWIDYVIADPISLPKDLAGEAFSEKPLYLAQSFFINSHISSHNGNLISAYELEKEMCLDDSPKEQFRFCNLNNHVKFSPNIFKMWCNIMQYLIENSKLDISLTLLEFPKESKPFLVDEFLRCFPDAKGKAKLKFLPFIGNPYQHQHRIYTHCDLWLDNPTYGAHTGAVDALFAGVPILAWGNNQRDMGGRVGYSILNTLGLENALVAHNETQYYSIAIRLVLDEKYMKKVREKLIDTMNPSQLNRFWNITSYVDSLEDAYFTAVYKHYTNESVISN